MAKSIALDGVTIHPIVEQQTADFDVMAFFPTLTKAQLDENRSWLQPTFLDPATNKLVFCIQGFVRT